METLFSGDAIVTWPRFELGWKGLTEDFPKNIASVRRMIGIFREHGWQIRQIATGHGDVRQMENGIDELEDLVAQAS